MCVFFKEIIMTITRLWQAGAEIGNEVEFTDKTSPFFYASTVVKNTGAYSFADSGSARYGWKTLPATRKARVGLFVYGNTTGDHGNCVTFRDASLNNLVSLYWKSTGAVEIRANNVLKDTEPGLNVLAWHHFGLDTKVDSTNGWIYAYFDGVEVMSFTGTTGNADITNIAIGNLDAAGDVLMYYDDIYVDDTTGESPAAVPIKRFSFITPNDNGNYSNWLGSDGNSTDNYLLVDDIPPDSDTTYVFATGTNVFDSYAMTTGTLGAGESCIALIPTVISKREGATEQIALGTRLSSTDLIGSEQSIGTSYDYFWERQIAKPGGGSWEQSDINDVEVVIYSTGTF